MTEKSPQKSRTKKLEDKSKSNSKKPRLFKKKEISSKCEPRSPEKKKGPNPAANEVNGKIERIKKQITTAGKVVRK